MQNVVVVAAKRTPMGRFVGALTDVPAPQLAGAVSKQLLADTELTPEAVDQLLLGCVLQAGIGQAPARQAGRAAGIADSCASVTINKVCGSGMEAVCQGTLAIRAGMAGAVIAGGMENMSRAPHMLALGRRGLGPGAQLLEDHLFLDGLTDPREGALMGEFADRMAGHYRIERDTLDNWALRSAMRVQLALEEGAFAAELAPLAQLQQDEPPRPVDGARIQGLKPAFGQTGLHTAASSSSIADGAAALLLMSEPEAHRRQLPVLVSIEGCAHAGGAASDFPLLPVVAAERLLNQLGWSRGEVLFEVNEAFAVVVELFCRQLHLSLEQINPRGGAMALGHPIGASGARILVSLIHGLADSDRDKGIASICIGGGEALAVAVRRGQL